MADGVHPIRERSVMSGPVKRLIVADPVVGEGVASSPKSMPTSVAAERCSVERRVSWPASKAVRQSVASWPISASTSDVSVMPGPTKRTVVA